MHSPGDPFVLFQFLPSLKAGFPMGTFGSPKEGARSLERVGVTVAKVGLADDLRGPGADSPLTGRHDNNNTDQKLIKGLKSKSQGGALQRRLRRRTR